MESIIIVCPTYAGPHQWNQLPLCVRHMQDRISEINYNCVSDISGPHQWNQLTLCVIHAGPHQWNKLPLRVRHMQDRISGVNYHCVSDICRTTSVESITIVSDMQDRSVESITIVCSAYAGPYLWNQLPLCVRHMQDHISGINYHCVFDMQDRISGINYHCVFDICRTVSM